MDYVLQQLKKENKNSESRTEKYEVLDCQNTIINNDTTTFIKLNDIIKSSSDLKIFNATFFNKHVIIKIGYSETIEREYKISHLLCNQTHTILLDDKYKYIDNENYFINYYCYFTCKNNIKNILINSSICSNNGNNMNILVMKKYKLGSIKNYNWNKDNFNLLKNLLKQIFYGFYISYVNFGFLHNDVHFGNFLIKEKNKKPIVVIIDFETSIFDVDRKNIFTLYYLYQQILNNILYELNIIVDDSINILLDYLETFKKHNKININLNYIFELIDGLNYVNKRDIQKMLIYNPNVF